ncbi:hypothetical protein IW140_006438 [Coemansia sp. RSA 1813]|nr:hypothetical protein IW140_006438 [Coemansia sp. RSA 1813]
MMQSSDPHGDSGTTLGTSPTAQPGSLGASISADIIKSLLKEISDQQAERDKQRDEKQEKRDRLWRTEQAEHDRLWRMEQAERDEKREKEQAALLEGIFSKQAERDKRLLEFQKQQVNALAKLEKAMDKLNQQTIQGAPVTTGANTAALRSAKLIGTLASSQKSIASQARSEAANHTGTPQVNVPKPDKFGTEWYVSLSKAYDKFCKLTDLPESLRMVSEGWREAWVNASAKTTLDNSPVVKKILMTYRKLCKDARATLAHAGAAETTYQMTFGKLAEARGSGPGRFPDGSFFIAQSPRCKWHDMVAVVEIKSSREAKLSHLLRGQIIQGFIDMAESRPRRFAFGISLGHQGEIHVYVCLPDGIHIASLGKLPLAKSTRASLANEQRVVAFLLFLYQQIAKDAGFLTRSAVSLPGEFALADIVGISPCEDNALPPDTMIHLGLDSDGVLGRHRCLKGPRTWLYPECRIGGKRAVFKFQWLPDGALESAVHQFVLAKGVPYVPALLYAATVASNQSSSSSSSSGKGTDIPPPLPIGEALVVEDVGSSVLSAFNKPEVEIIDIFAAYTHTLISAAKIHESQFVLHRDVSLGNLMVTRKGHPYIIDWGCGHVCHIDKDRLPSGKVIVRTAIYMGIRILRECRTRSVIDDLESLFLVFCHCLWRQYGTKNLYYEYLWTRGDLHFVKVTRIDWLRSKTALFEHMEIKGNLPEPHRTLAEGMFDLLFPSSSPVSSFERNINDPRVAAFSSSEWLHIFEKAVDITGSAATPYLKQLQDYIATNPDRRISFIAEETSSPVTLEDYMELANGTEASCFDSPTRGRGSKRGSTSQIGSANAKISRH